MTQQRILATAARLRRAEADGRLRRERLYVLPGWDDEAVEAVLSQDLSTWEWDDVEEALVKPGWYATDGHHETHLDVSSGREAAEEYVEGGSWGEPAERTTWVRVQVWRWGLALGVWGGLEARPTLDHEVERVAIDPSAPDCAPGEEHRWEEKEVRGHGGGVVVSEFCAYCGCGKTVDTWAQCPETGEQGLVSVEYEAERYSDELRLHLRPEVERAVSLLREMIPDGTRTVEREAWEWVRSTDDPPSTVEEAIPVLLSSRCARARLAGEALVDALSAGAVS